MSEGYFADTVERDRLDVDGLDDYDFEPSEVVIREDGCSEGMKAYFRGLEEELQRAYDVAERVRARGLDPELEVEIPPAEDLAARVEKLVGPEGVAERIRALAKEKGREEVALLVSKEVAGGKFGEFESNAEAVDQAVRTGLAILTEGILVAPLEGIAGVRIVQNNDGTDCVAVSFAGPIRAAGGTGQALSVLIADVVRRELGIGKYVPTEAEVGRYKEEVPGYKQAASLQYTPTAEEIELIVKNCPVMLDGEGTEQEEVGGNRDLPRIETNNLRGGMCLVLAEGLTLKAPKIQKHVKSLGLEGWEFIDTFVNKGKKKAAAEDDGGEKPKGPPPIEANWKYVQELIAGRPVFSHPSRRGGFRLRYGRARTGGLASTAIHPATMVLVNDFLAVGTQMKVERPGKATVATPCDELDGPVVRLHSGDVVEVTTVAQARELFPRVRRIIDVGEMLVPFGEFAENNKTLPRSAWVHEWWALACEAAGAPADAPASAREALEHAAAHGVPLHPRHTLLWHDLTTDQVEALGAWVEAHGRLEPPAGGEGADPALALPADDEMKALLEELLALHAVRGEELVVDARYGLPLARCLGLEEGEGGGLVRARSAHGFDAADDPFPSVALVSHLAGVPVRPRAPYRIGTRMGRPEKAAERKMSPAVHTLFPLGHAGGPQRLVKDAAKEARGSRDGCIPIEVGMRACPQCKRKTVLNTCPQCPPDDEGRQPHTEPVKGRPEMQSVPLHDLLTQAQERLGVKRLPETIKGVQGLISRSKTPEPLEKGILRAKHDVSCFKDGTIRFDMTDVTLTHFKPREIHTSVEKLRELGYTHDARGEPLERDDQVLELKVQDLVVSETCMSYLHRTANFVDELLARYYGYVPYYDCDTPDDLIGHLLVGLAPHTSGGVLGRLIGWTTAQAGFAHPYYHAAKRRNCDGDEDCVMLLLDGLINFSRAYLPANRGGLMDAPLTLSTRINPAEIDKEAHNVDVGWSYPLEFYEATCAHPGPKDVEELVDTVASRLGTEGQYEGFGFTHDTADVAEGPAASSYKTIGDMMGKMDSQLELAVKIRAVDAPDVAARVIGSHFLPDLIGNLKAFSKQKMRCTKCNAKYRRIPIQGRCLKCSNPNLTMTVHEGSVVKYLTVSKEVCEKYDVNPYVRQRIEHIEDSIDSLFQNDKVKKAKLSDFF